MGEDRIAFLEAELAKLKAERGMSVHGPEVTVLIPTFNAMDQGWLPRCLFRLEMGAQSEPLVIHIQDQESKDGTWEFIQTAAKARWAGRVELLPQCKNFGSSQQNLPLIRKNLAMSVKTPFAMFVDADVKTPVGGVRALLDAMKADPKLGVLGIQYMAATDHVKCGCTMWRSELLKTIDWRFADGKCECANADADAVKAGFKVAHLPGYFAEHMKDAQGG